MLRCACLLGGLGTLTCSPFTASFCYELVHVSLLPYSQSPFTPPVSRRCSHSRSTASAPRTSIRSSRASGPTRRLPAQPCIAGAPPENHRPHYTNDVGSGFYLGGASGFRPTLEPPGARAGRPERHPPAMEHPRRDHSARIHPVASAAGVLGRVNLPFLQLVRRADEDSRAEMHHGTGQRLRPADSVFGVRFAFLQGLSCAVFCYIRPACRLD